MSLGLSRQSVVGRLRAERGFTLVEVSVALTILALVMLVTVTALRTLGNTQVAVERQIARVDEIRSVSSFLRDLFESAVVGSSSEGLSLGGGSRGVTHFAYDQDFLELKSTVLFGEGFGGSYLVRLARRDETLVLQWQEAAARPVTAASWKDAPSRVIIEQLQEFAVATRAGPGADWLVGDDSGAMPDLVRLQIKSANRYWPDLILKVQR